VDAVTILDDLADLNSGLADWTTRTLLYAGNGLAGNPYEHLPPPSCTLMAKAQSRVFLAGVDQDPTAVWVSNEVVLGEGVSYFDGLRFRVGSPPTAVVGRDRNVVVFTEDRIWTVTGEFPDNAGGSFPIPTAFELPHEVGAIDPNAIVVTSLGIYFQSKKGLHILGWDWSVNYIGRPGGGLAGHVAHHGGARGAVAPAGAPLHRGRDHARVGHALQRVDDVFAGQPALSACNWQDKPVYVTAGGWGWQSRRQARTGTTVPSWTRTSNSRSSRPRGCAATTAWRPSSSWARSRDPTQLHASLAYNGAPTVATSYSAINEALPGDDGVLKWELRPKKRQCSSWQLSISDAQLTVGTTEGFSLQAIVASVGIEGGLDRLRAALRMKGS
jgi:hypothetical protein